MINKISSINQTTYRGINKNDRQIPWENKWCLSCKYAVIDKDGKITKKACSNCKRYDYGMPTKYQKK